MFWQFPTLTSTTNKDKEQGDGFNQSFKCPRANLPRLSYLNTHPSCVSPSVLSLLWPTVSGSFNPWSFISSHAGRVLAMPCQRESALQAGAGARAGSGKRNGSTISHGRGSHWSLPPAPHGTTAKLLTGQTLNCHGLETGILKLTCTDCRSL